MFKTIISRIKTYALYFGIGMLLTSAGANYILYTKLQGSQTKLESISQHNQRLTTTLELKERTEALRGVLSDSFNTKLTQSLSNEQWLALELQRIQCECPSEAVGSSQSDSSNTQYVGVGKGVKIDSTVLQTGREGSNTISEEPNEESNTNRTLTPDSVRMLKSGIHRSREEARD